jgi:SAM-dependent methyltransferase
VGFDNATIRVLLTARQAGVSFRSVLTIGRQWLHIRERELRRLLRRHGISLSARQTREFFTAEKGYCEPLLKLLGAAQVDSIDASSYEGASIVHDMNQPLPEAHRDKYSMVIDGGSLEHVFDYPTALRNCMEAVAPGGHFVGVTPANNLMGHGFYQFSPELFFRVFTTANGFQIINLLIYEYPLKGVWYEVADPEQVGRRVQLTNHRPAYLIVWARKTASVPIFARPPQQSDYMAIWNRCPGGRMDNASLLPRSLPTLVKLHLHASLARAYLMMRPFRTKFYTGKKPSLLVATISRRSPNVSP